MWIRSPEKALIVDGDRFFVDEESDGRSYIYVNGSPVASYSKHEKAMKVMDMIETSIIENEIANSVIDIGYWKKGLFQMPKDDEVEV